MNRFTWRMRLSYSVADNLSSLMVSGWDFAGTQSISRCWKVPPLLDYAASEDHFGRDVALRIIIVPHVRRAVVASAIIVGPITPVSVLLEVGAPIEPGNKSAISRLARED